MKKTSKYAVFRALPLGEVLEVTVAKNAEFARYHSAAYCYNMSEARDKGENITLKRDTANGLLKIEKRKWPYKT